ncbi:hypothetical protein DRQ53_15940, partial [bacterium]
GPIPDIEYPEWIPHCSEYLREVTLQNYDEETLYYSLILEEHSGPAGWLSVTGFTGMIPTGENNSDTGTIICNTGGIVCDPGSTVWLDGRVIVSIFIPLVADTINIHIPVTSEIPAPVIDTVSTACLSLALLSNGSCGNQGVMGRVQMDYVDAGDCDPEATVYLYDGSPVLGWLDETDTVMNWSIFGNGYTQPYSFVQQSTTPTYITADYEAYSSTFLTHDSSIMLEKTYYAPLAPDTCHFVIQELRFWSNDGLSHDNLIVGEAVDWDVPADSNFDNGSGFNAAEQIIYQFGAEYGQDDATECQENDARFAGIKFLHMYVKSGDWTELDGPYGATTGDGPTWIYNTDNGFEPGELYERMAAGGYSLYESSNPDSQYVDLHSLMTYSRGLSLFLGDTLIVYTALMTVENGTESDLFAYGQEAAEWLCEHVPDACQCICGECGDVDGDGLITIADVTYFVNWIATGGPAPMSTCAIDVDGYQGVTIMDYDALWDYYTMLPFWPPDLTCPGDEPRLDGPVSSNHYVRLLSDGNLPASETNMTLELELTLEISMKMVSLPVRILVDGAPVTVDDLRLTDLLDSPSPIPVTQRITPNGIYVASVDNDMLSGKLAEVDISVTAAAYDRLIYLEWYEAGDGYCGGVIEYPVVVVYDYTAWLPGLICRLPSPECCEQRGNVDHLGDINVSDLTYLVAYLFQNGFPPPCEEEGDVDASGAINVSDLTSLVAYMFSGGPGPLPCP